MGLHLSRYDGGGSTSCPSFLATLRLCADADGLAVGYLESQAVDSEVSHVG